MMKSSFSSSSNNNASPNKFSQFRPAAEIVGQSTAKEAKQGARTYVTFIKENGSLLKGLAVLAALALMTVSILGFIWIVNIVHPVWYVVNAVNIFFAAIILLVEGPATWTWCGLRPSLFENFGFLGKPLGRAGFYFYVGMMVITLHTSGENAFMFIAYTALGGCFIIVGVLQFLMYCRCCCFKREEEEEIHVEDI